MTEVHSTTPKRRVVIIEDDPDFTARLTRLLDSLGHQVVVRLDSSARETYDIRGADIIFLDLLMPRVSGIQVLEQLDRQNARSPIVLMSANDQSLRDAQNAMKKLQLWLLGVLFKPFSLDDLRAVLKGV